MLNDREWATLIWLLAGLAFVLWKPDIRGRLRGVIVAFAAPRLLPSMLLYVGWIIGVVWLAARLGIWRADQVKDTILWTIPGFGLVLATTEAPREIQFFRRRFWETVGVTAMLSLYLDLGTLDMWLEVVLQGVLALAAAVGVYAAYTKQKPVERLAYLLVGVILLLLLVPPTLALFSDLAAIDATKLVRDVALPVWLTLSALPLVFVLSLWLTYAEAFRLMRAASTNGRVPWRAKVALLVSFHFRIGAVHGFARDWPRMLLRIKGFRHALRVVATQQADLRAAAAVEKRRKDDLVRYAGVPGTDAQGGQLDRREFQETSEALTWLSTSQMGRYDTGGCYDRGVLDGFPPTWLKGLPEDHGITIRVSRSGESWLAWRRTVTGWCFAIGSAGPPMDQWYYDGPEPPKGFPGRDPAWGDEPFELGPNWMGSE